MTEREKDTELGLLSVAAADKGKGPEPSASGIAQRAVVDPDTGLSSDSPILQAITDEALNGDHYLGSQEGETLRAASHRIVYFPSGCPSAENPHEQVTYSQMEAFKFLKLNMSKLIGGKYVMDVLQAFRIAWLRLLAVKEGLISYKFKPDSFFVDYTEAYQCSPGETHQHLGRDSHVTNEQISGVLTREETRHLGDHFTDMVCSVAFVFRARGHHYTAELNELYAKTWERCRYTANDLKLSWEHIAVYSLHAVFPSILDAFWVNAAKNGYCNGALTKRLDVAPAGFAAPFVLSQGLADIRMVAPGIDARLEGEIDYLDELLRAAAAHRFNGSVNARYYGAERIKLDEKRLAAMAAVIKAAVDNLSDNAPLGKSPALKRIANNAPVTGAVLGRAIGAISNRPETVNALLIAHT